MVFALRDQRTSGKPSAQRIMEPECNPPQWWWAYNHNNMGGIRYAFTWDRSLGELEQNQYGVTGWINLRAAYSGHRKLQLPALGATPMYVHSCSYFPCHARWHEPLRLRVIWHLVGCEPLPPGPSSTALAVVPNPWPPATIPRDTFLIAATLRRHADGQRHSIIQQMNFGEESMRHIPCSILNCIRDELPMLEVAMKCTCLQLYGWFMLLETLVPLRRSSAPAGF